MLEVGCFSLFMDKRQPTGRVGRTANDKFDSPITENNDERYMGDNILTSSSGNYKVRYDGCE